MPFDGIVIKNCIAELRDKCLGNKVDKVQQPEKDEIILNIRGYKETLRLVLSASSNYPKIHLTTLSKQNPMVAPAFCMLLRKHLSGAKIIAIEQPRMDRIVEIEFECFDELGYSNHKKMIIEIMGRNSNIIFIDGASHKIIDCIKRVDEEVSRLREVLPGLIYEYPPGFNKHNPLEITEDKFFQLLHDDIAPVPVYKFVYQYMYGISPLAASEICQRGQLPEDLDIRDISNSQAIKLYTSIQSFLSQTEYQPQIILSSDKVFKDFYCFDIGNYAANEKISCSNINEMIDTFYSKRDLVDRIKQRTGDLRKLLNNKLDRCYKKLAIQVSELDSSIDAKKFKIYGDLITSYTYLLNKGDEKAILQNFYSPEGESIEIRLDPLLSPIENAQRYYKQYTKSKHAKEILGKQISSNKEDIAYLEGQLFNLENCTSELDIREIREELIDLGYIKRTGNKKIKQTKKAAPLSFHSPSGFEIFVGKNNFQNDQLTLRTAAYNDLWFHAKDMPGSHVIIRSGGAKVDDATLEYAASLAAYYSKGKNAAKVPVDYTLRKYVKKPNGAKPGMVIYSNQTTVYVTPKSE